MNSSGTKEQTSEDVNDQKEMEPDRSVLTLTMELSVRGVKSVDSQIVVLG